MGCRPGCFVKPGATMRKDGRGFTLVEVLMAMLVFVVAVVALLGLYVGVSNLRESSRNMAQAMADARTVLEEIREASGASLATVTGTDWTTWAEDNNLTSLPNEVITVTFEDENADPLEVTVQVDWTERGRLRQPGAVVETLVTQRQ